VAIGPNTLLAELPPPARPTNITALPDSLLSVSPSAHYSLTAIEPTRCASGRCSSSVGFTFRGRGACQGKLVCTKMGGNVCGDYGLALSMLVNNGTGE